MKLSTISLMAMLVSGGAMAAPLQFTVYNPAEQGIFPVASTLVSGEKQVILFDAQFSVKDGEKLVSMIRDSGKKLTRIVITAGDPDYYFGLQPLVKAFPGVEVVATQRVVDHIKATQQAKLSYWGPKMGDGAPQKLITPQVIPDTRFSLEGQPIDIRDADSQQAYVWFPQQRTLLGGTGVDAGIHVWTADTQTAESRKQWRDTLQQMLDLKPQRVIPGHYIGKAPSGDQAISFTLNYLQDFEKALQQHKDSAAVISSMEKRWPHLADKSSLELSAKVNTGEVKWQ
ncbi:MULTISPECIES: Vmh family MBL fold metallo-hydrolase [Tatumella]|uniref:Vmh family MBL fold metallo-hydrolase n=1 Tax=Tatumella punctata TaxID=399969 RepID=A0ABW1VQV6_9GAMM|nr:MULTISPECIES: Vmh family MBL fold metallo-hydrolase [unclassified Tatumella]MBS0857285.1 MBL fold metallo-hydrolase [Tatumella sp. JGM16]MBS0878691.1 MBL fold metallo-hydrolase [Tatumella sp. JGM82]MBS0891861.1 MBL fold metallo-hydrolase [Tatumella sp. JGM94]MBS0894899.1 MBL fold metallo-hydrolase [Tatumella sp. JGM130]MBS0903284.1 MBL fold metallo-hydrolase [Tatumella sp. JGM100]